MGMVFGKIRVETRKFEVLKTTPDYEIRKYPSSVIAQITYNPSDFNSDKDGGFQILAKYIGVFGKPENVKPEKIAMTSPVITQTEKIAMTSPVVSPRADLGINIRPTLAITYIRPCVSQSAGELVTMGFILPSKYQKAEDAPKPVDERVVVRDEGEKKYGVVTFSGSASDKVVEDKVKGLKECLERDGEKVVGEFVLSRYNPPWTLPPFRTNEVLIPIA